MICLQETHKYQQCVQIIVEFTKHIVIALSQVLLHSCPQLRCCRAGGLTLRRFDLGLLEQIECQYGRSCNLRDVWLTLTLVRPGSANED